MRIVRFALDSLPKFGVLEDGSDSIVVLKNDPLFGKIEPEGQILELSKVRLLSPMIPRSKVVQAIVHGEKLTFSLKPNTSVIGPDVAVVKPEYAEKVYSQGSIGVIIKSICKNIEPSQVDKYLLGYIVANNISVSVKDGFSNDLLYTNCFDTSCVVGPWIVVDNEINPNNLTINVFANNDLKHKYDLKKAPNSLAEIISKISKVTTLLPGDIVTINSGEEKNEIKIDDLMRIDIDGLGSISNVLVETD